jgi:hypothetical protein
MEKEVNGKMQGRSRKLAAAIMAMVAITTIAYANAIMGTITLSTAEAVWVSDITDIFPARSAGVREYAAKITLDLSGGKGFKDHDDVVVRVELVPLDAEVYAGFRALIIQIVRGGTVKATLTMNTPYAEFKETDITLGTYNYDVRIIFATGYETVTATIGLNVMIVGILP